MNTRSGQPRSIGDIIAEKNIIIKGGDAFTKSGFTQVPNAVLRDGKLSPAAKLTYAMLLSYAWQNDYCFPGQERLAEDMGSGKRSVVRYIDELEKKGFINIKRRGQGRPNIYEIIVR